MCPKLLNADGLPYITAGCDGVKGGPDDSSLSPVLAAGYTSLAKLVDSVSRERRRNADTSSLRKERKHRREQAGQRLGRRA